jgi:hypothetical protein
VRDLKYVLKINGVAAQFASSRLCDAAALSCEPSDCLLLRWLGILRLVEAMDLQLRQLGSHVEFESRSWLNAFNLAISMGSVFEVAFQGLHAGADAALNASDTGGDAGAAAGSTSESSADFQVRVNRLLSIGRNTLQELNDWQNMDSHSKAPVVMTTTTSHGLPPFVEPFESYHFQSSTHAVSFHLPLHRFLGALVRTAVACGLPIKQLLQQLQLTRTALPSGSDSEDEHGTKAGSGSSPTNRYSTLINHCYAVCPLINPCYAVCPLINPCYAVCPLITHCYAVCPLINRCSSPTSSLSPLPPTLLAESPLRALVTAGQVHIGMWRRNGIALKNQVGNYWGVGLCREMRDLDLLLLQTSTIIKVCTLINHCHAVYIYTD